MILDAGLSPSNAKLSKVRSQDIVPVYLQDQQDQQQIEEEEPQLNKYRSNPNLQTKILKEVESSDALNRDALPTQPS